MTDGVLTLAMVLDAVRDIEEKFGPVSPKQRLIPSPYWPTKQDGWETARRPAHPLVRWLATWLPITPYAEYERPRIVECPPMITKDGSVYMGLRAYAALKAAAPKAQ